MSLIHIFRYRCLDDMSIYILNKLTEKCLFYLNLKLLWYCACKYCKKHKFEKGWSVEDELFKKKK